MVTDDFIDFLTDKETLKKFKKNEKGNPFRKAKPIEIAAVVLFLLKQKDKYDFWDNPYNPKLTHAYIRNKLEEVNGHVEIELPLSKKAINRDGKYYYPLALTSDTIYSILRGFKFFDPHKTEEKYFIDRTGKITINNELGKRYNNWRINTSKLCEFLGYEGDVYENDLNKEVNYEYEERDEQIPKRNIL